MVELAKRQTASVKKIGALRGMNHREIQKALPQLADAIAKALALPDDECPSLNRRQSRPQMNALTQFMACALSTICRTYHIAPAITGTSDDMRDLLNHLLHPKKSKRTPSLAKGWRAQVVGSKIQDILDGRIALAVDSATGDNPITFRDI